MVWDALFEVNLDLLYTIESRALELKQSLTMNLVDNTFSGDPIFNFTGVSNGQVLGFFGYSMPAQSFGVKRETGPDRRHTGTRVGPDAPAEASAVG
jgi:hypothetical protein